MYDGIDPETFLCRDCPIRVSGPLDETSVLALSAWSMLAGAPIPEAPPSVEFVFTLLEIPVESALAREVYHRLQLIGEIMQQRQSHAKGAKPSQEDLLAGSGFGEDDDNE